MTSRNAPSLCEMLYGNFTGDLDLHRVSEENQVILSVLDNMQRILNCCAGTLAHLPDYGLPDMTTILQGLPGTARKLMFTLLPDNRSRENRVRDGHDLYAED